MGCIGIAILLVGGIAILGALLGGGSDDNGDAEVVACQNVVTENLKSPSTANFVGVPSYSDGVIRGEVDSENGFGATVRSSFQCTDVGDGRVRLDYLQ